MTLMDSDDRLTDHSLHPPSDVRLTDLPPHPSGLPPAFPDVLSPVTIRVVAFVAFVYVFWPFAATCVLAAAGLVPRPTAAPTPEQTQALMRLQLVVDSLAFPLQIASILLFLPRVAGIRLEQIGLTFRRFGWNCLWGAAGWLILYPVCFAVNYGVILLYGSAAASNVQEHPFEQMAQHGLPPAVWFLLIFTATVSAPVMEEVLFRGALQSWLERCSWAPHIAMGLAFLTALAMKGTDVCNALPQGGAALLLHLTPILFLLGLSVVYLMVWRFSRTPAAPAVFASSALFASVHSFAWPSPVALFLLALGLGWLAQRTRSLVGPIVLHGLFNGVSCVLLLFPQITINP
jgi:membrane protease YdiL (CAAX protease family)